MKTLPNKPSELIRIALTDLQSCVADPEYYIINMDTWHEPVKNGKCEVCMAGAVMAKTLNIDRERREFPSSLGSKFSSKLCAIDYFRGGYVGLAFMRLLLSFKDGKKYDRIIPSFDLKDKFFFAMYRLADDLEKDGY